MSPTRSMIYFGNLINQREAVMIMKENEKVRAEKILAFLRCTFPVPELSSIVDEPFKVLVRTIISQSTTEINTRRAYRNLSLKIPITPERLATANVKEIELALKVAGLYRNKALNIRKCAKLVLEKFKGSFDFIFSSPLNEAREQLMSLPGVGPKTTDVVLLFCGKRPTIPIDVHVGRVSKRLELVPANADYECMRNQIQLLFSPEEYFSVHMLFIALGRNYCKAKNPLHESCPVREFCPTII